MQGYLYEGSLYSEVNSIIIIRMVTNLWHSYLQSSVEFTGDKVMFLYICHQKLSDVVLTALINLGL